MRTLAALGLLLACAATASAQSATTDPDSARIITADIENFWRGYDRLRPGSTRADSARVFAETYFQAASPGLETFIRTRIQQPENLLMGLGMLPRYYAAVRANTLRLREKEPLIRSSLRRLQAFYPQARFPDIYFIISGFIAQGVVSEQKVIIGAEMVSADAATPMHELPKFLSDVTLTSAALPCILVHELVHFQQDYAQDSSLLAQALMEGVADFITDRAIGCYPTAAATYQWGAAHERELWEDFRATMHRADHSKWLYNGNISSERPTNLGYWMGYQIAQAYYDRAANKAVTVHELLHIRDFAALLEASGYADRFEQRD